MRVQLKKQKRLERQLELLKNFPQENDHYEEKKIGNDWYVKMWNGGTKRWQVAVFSEVAFRRYKEFDRAKKENERQQDFFRSLR